MGEKIVCIIGKKKKGKEEKQFTERLAYMLMAPTIVWPQMEGSITEEMKQRCKTERLLAVAQGVEGTATDFEAMIFISSATLANPPSQTWFRLYIHLFKRFYPEQHKQITGEMGEEREPQPHELQELERLKQWIYKKQTEAIKAKQKQ